MDSRLGWMLPRLGWSAALAVGLALGACDGPTRPAPQPTSSGLPQPSNLLYINVEGRTALESSSSGRARIGSSADRRRQPARRAARRRSAAGSRGIRRVALPAATGRQSGPLAARGPLQADRCTVPPAVRSPIRSRSTTCTWSGARWLMD